MMRNWLIRNGCFVTKAEKDKGQPRPTTHLLLDGGTLHIEEEKEAEFLRTLAEALYVERESLYIVECKTPVFKMMMDLDIFENRELAFMEADKDRTNSHLLSVESIVKCIQCTFSQFYSNAAHQKLLDVLVCRTEPKTEIKKSGDGQPDVVYTKTGIHLIWPDVHVDMNRAQALRRAMIYDLNNKFGSRHAHNSWDDAVDPTVLNKNGLRMLGCRKCHICTSCRNKPVEKQTCRSCCGSGRFDEGRIYKPALVMRHDGSSNAEELMKLADLKLYLMQRSSIRLPGLTNPPDAPTFAVPPSYAIELNPTNARSAGQKLRWMKQRNQALHEPHAGTHPYNNQRRFLPDTDWRVSGLRKFVQSNFPSNPEITKVEQRNNYYTCHSTSRYCINKGGEHNNNHVYFVVSPAGARQRCLCQCVGTPRKFHVDCNNFQSEWVPLPPRLFASLYPEMRQRKKESLYPDPSKGVATTCRNPNESSLACFSSSYEACMQEVEILRERVASNTHQQFMQ